MGKSLPLKHSHVVAATAAVHANRNVCGKEIEKEHTVSKKILQIKNAESKGTGHVKHP
jgi:hypothetical protein